MTVAVGEIAYNHDTSSCSGVGLVWTADDLSEALSGPVATVLLDDEGTAEVEEILAALAETEFEKDGLAAILSVPAQVENWRVGEAIGETYLTDHRSCTFPWPDGRDERKRGSSLPGADLVGFCVDDKGDYFAFGEAKTSSDANHPPTAMYGRTGLKKQLEDLRDRADIRDHLVKYLCHRAKFADWRPRFEEASKRYLRNKSDVGLYGLLIRDVEPHSNDVVARVKSLGQNCPDGTRIELLALYLPQSSIVGLGEMTLSTRGGRNR